MPRPPAPSAPPAPCHPDRPVYARGLCTSCYDRERRTAEWRDARPARRAVAATASDIVGRLEAATGLTAIIDLGRAVFDFPAGSTARRRVHNAYLEAVWRVRPLEATYGDMDRTPVVVPSERKYLNTHAGTTRRTGDIRPPAQHGTTTRYHAGCRCVPCRAVNAERHRARRAERGAVPRPGGRRL